jgi:hypothetical protein
LQIDGASGQGDEENILSEEREETTGMKELHNESVYNVLIRDYCVIE